MHDSVWLRLFITSDKTGSTAMPSGTDLSRAIFKTILNEYYDPKIIILLCTMMK